MAAAWLQSGGGDSDGGGPTKKLIVGGVLVVLSIIAIVRLWPASNPALNAAMSRVYICSETGKTFEHEVTEGEVEPILSPYSDKATGWLAEACYWTKDGQGSWKGKDEPTYVLLKSRMDPDNQEPTYCPDCGREVRPHNDRPDDVRPPRR